MAVLVPVRGSSELASDRVVDATLRCIARWGLAKTTLDDVAREAGCGRATLYRLFPGGREALLAGVVEREWVRFLARLAERVAAERGLEDVVVGIVTEASRAIEDHAALQFLLEHEPEAVLPHLAFNRMDRVLVIVADAVAPLLVPWLGLEEDDRCGRAAEWLVRIVLSHATSPAASLDLRDEDCTRRLVRRYVLGGLVAPSRSPGGAPSRSPGGAPSRSPGGPVSTSLPST